MKLNKLAAAVSLSLVAGGASAALTTPFSGGPSSVLFAIDDNVISSSNVRHTFLLDLGLNYADFVNKTNGAGGNLSWDLSSISAFNGFSNDISNLSRWSVVGGYALKSDFSNFDQDGSWYSSTEAADASAAPAFSGPAQWGVLSTGHKANGADFKPLGYLELSKVVGSTSGKIGSWINQAGILLGANTAADVAQFDATKSQYDNYFGTAYGNWIAGGSTAPNTVQGAAAQGVTLANSADFYWLTTETGLGTSDANDLIKLGTFSLDANTKKLTYNAVVTAVPLPTAAWLFLSGVMGVLGLKRRNSQTGFAA